MSCTGSTLMQYSTASMTIMLAVFICDSCSSRSNTVSVICSATPSHGSIVQGVLHMKWSCHVALIVLY